LRIRSLILAGLFAGVTAVGAQITLELPFTPVPITLQVFAVLLAGFALGPRLGAMSMAVYLLLGAMGVPVFARFRAGLPVLLGPTGGYLLVFPLAAWVTGRLSSGRANTLGLSSAGCVGVAVIYLVGTCWLKASTGIEWSAAIGMGALPFIPMDLAKAIWAALVAKTLRRAGIGHTVPR